MQILLTNDDGIYSPGLAALERELARMGDVCVVAPATEQSGVGHSITYLTPLIVKEVFDGQRRRGFALEGSPADCTKLGITELCPKPPQLVVSGINAGLNVGINVLYSGTVAAAIEGAFFNLTSIAVSLEYDEHADYAKAASLAVRVIERIAAREEAKNELFNLNIPTEALTNYRGVKIVPMGKAHYGNQYLKRADPKGRPYYWATGEPDPLPTDHMTDLTAIRQGYITVSPLHFDLTKHSKLEQMQGWELGGGPDS